MGPAPRTTGATEQAPVLARRFSLPRGVGGVIRRLVSLLVQIARSVQQPGWAHRTSAFGVAHCLRCLPLLSMSLPHPEGLLSRQYRCRYPPTIPSTGYEGGSGFLSGNPAQTVFADWGVAYLKYCDGTSMTGGRADPQIRPDAPGGNLWYRGRYNLQAQLDHLVATKGLGNFDEIVFSGCSAGGMACYLNCDRVARLVAR